MSAILDTYKYGKKDPFYNDPVQRAYYHPSPPRNMNSKARRTGVGPSHKHQDLPASAEEEESRGDYVPDSSNSFLISRIGELGLRPDGDSLSFDESWPQSERPSTISISEVENLSPPSAVPLRRRIPVDVERNRKGVGTGSELDTGAEDKWRSSKSEGGGKTRGKESTLSKYIERFRNSQPMSREQRRLQMKATTDAAAAGEEEFWWLNHQSPSTQMMSSATDEQQQHPPLQSTTHTRSVLQGKENSLLLNDDEDQLHKKTKLLQENTSDFLETMSSVGSSHPAVSTVGLGSDSTNLTTLEEEEPYRPAFVRSREPLERRIPQHSRHDNDDILQRWRSQRKREQAKDEVTKRLRTEQQPLNNFSSQWRQPDAESATSQMTRLHASNPHLPPHLPAHLPPQSCSQPADREKYAELKREAAIQTSGVFDDALVVGPYVPIASCPHLTSSHTIPLVTPPHSHLTCDLLTQTEANRSCSGSRQMAATTSMGDGPKAHKAQSISGQTDDDEQRRRIRRSNGSHAFSSDRGVYLSDENVPERDVRCSCLHDGHDAAHLPEEKRVNRKTKYSAQKDQRSLRRPLKVIHQKVIVSGDDVNDTDVWQTTDDEEKRRIGMEMEEEEKRKSEKKRRGRQPLSAPKNQSSPLPIPSAIRQGAITDRLLVAASPHSIVSSVENFELSSLDLTVCTELEEPEQDNGSVPAAGGGAAGGGGGGDEGGSSCPVDLESVVYSDGEEFADDDILCNLRQRRLFCLQRLQELDQLILQSRKA